MKIRTITLIALSVILAIALIYAIVGSFEVDKVVGKQCGPEAVVPCVEYDITEKVDLLEQNRTVAITVVSGLLIISGAALFVTASKKRNS